jgi:uncharacterized repeat protein (TIGR01451 family)
MSASRIHLVTMLLLVAALVPLTAHAQSASLSVDLAFTSPPPAAGGTLTFQITVNNEGPSPADNVVLTTAVPTNSTFDSLATPGGWSCTTPAVGATGTIDCSTPALAVGSAVFTLIVATSASSPPGTPVTLAATVVSTTPDPDPNDNMNQLTVLLVWQSNLAVTKTGPAQAFAGAVIGYTIAIDNPGPSNAADLTVTDTFAAPLRFVAVTAPGWTCLTPAVGSAGTVTCTRSQIPLGVTNLTLQLDTAPSTAPTTVTNDVSVAASTDPSGPRLGSASTPITTSADLTISKGLAPNPPVAGQSLTYTATITQNGPSDAANVTFSDPLPSAVPFQSITAPGWTCTTPAVGATGTVDCTRTPLAPGVYTITIQGTLPASTPAGTAIVNTASVTSTTSDPTTPNTATSSATVATQADLSIAKSAAPPAPVAGEALAYTLTVTQSGPSDAANVTVTDALPAAVQFQSITAPGWTCTTPAVGATGTVSCSRAALPAGSYTIAIQTLVAASTPSGTVIVNTASVASATPDPTPPTPATASVTTTTQADLSIAKSAAPPAPAAGQALTYTLTVTQSGPSDAANVTVTDALPAAVQFQSITAPGWTCTTPAVGATGTVSCSRAALPAGSYTITIQTLVAPSTPSGTVIVNTASVASTTPDPTPPTPATASVTTTAQADLSITIADSPDPVAPGGSLTYQVTVTNAGPSDAASPTLSFTLDPTVGFTSVTAPAGWSCTTPAVGASGVVTCTAASLAGGGSALFTIVTSVPGVLTGGAGSIAASATVGASTSDPNPANNSASATTAITGAAAIPTLSELGFGAMVALLVLFALLKLRAGPSHRRA